MPDPKNTGRGWKSTLCPLKVSQVGNYFKSFTAGIHYTDAKYMLGEP